MKIGILGAGRLGLCFALLLDHAGYEVVASDIRSDYVSNLRQGVIETQEPYVKEMLQAATSPRQFRPSIKFETNNIDVIMQCDLLFTFVATPSLPDGSYDVSCIRQIIKDIKKCKSLAFGKSLVVGCTTNPGDCQDFQNHLTPYGVSVYYNPEFIAQGSIVNDLRNADMVLIGGEGNHLDRIKQIYNDIQDIEPSIHTMSTKAAELVKLAVNCFLTTKISYANMIGQVMEKSGMEDEIDNVLNAIGSDSRVGKKYLGYGFGFGGPCLPRDNRAFAATAKKLGLKYNLGEVIDQFNNEHHQYLLEWCIGHNYKSLPFVFDSIAYKAGTDILTESQSYRLCLELLDMGYDVYVIDDTVKDQCDGRINWGEPDPRAAVFSVRL